MFKSKDLLITDLWLQFKAGDKEAFKKIAEINYKHLFQYGTKFTADRELINDCLQDLFLELCHKRSSLNEISSLKPYLFRALRNNLLRRIKRQALFSTIDSEEIADFNTFSPETDFIIKETDHRLSNKIQKMMDSLPKRQREALYLRYYEDLSYKEIASIMGLKRQAVANYLQSGIQKLRDFWQLHPSY